MFVDFYNNYFKSHTNDDFQMVNNINFYIDII